MQTKPPAVAVRTVRAKDVRLGDVVRYRRPSGNLSPWGPVVGIEPAGTDVMITIRMTTMDFPVALRPYDLIEWQEESP